ncbi:class IV adenylate cyclase [Candidatus Woesearchaeota archaeon]|nr:class IV adenylate cyclase [Candidatus Woesearchaeota archaeon]
MIEVEIKARISNVDDIKKKLNQIRAKFLKTEKQIDKVFGHPRFLDSEKKIIEGGFVARIRVVDDNHTLEFKEILRQNGGVEIKSELKDLNTGVEFLNKLNFKEKFTVSKSRDHYSYNNFAICLDNVKQLGNFIEIEKIVTSSEEKENARKRCLDLLNTLAPNSEIEDKKYGDLIQEKINKGEIKCQN